MKKIKFSIFAKKVRGGMLGVFVNCIQSSKRVLVDTEVRIFPDEWDEDNSIVINNPNSAMLNRVIRKCVYSLQDMEFSSDNGITLRKLLSIWNDKESYYDFYAFFLAHLSDNGVRPSTSALHRNTLNILRDYKEKCLLCELDEDFVEGFFFFLRKHTFNGTRHYADSSIMKHIKVFRAYYNKARKAFPNKVSTIDFSKFRSYSYADKPIKSLDDNDIRILEKQVNCETRTKDAIVVDQFLFMAYTGCRYSDFISLSEANIKIGYDASWLIYTSVKTNVPVKLPINLIFDGRAEQMLYKYKGRLDKFFTIPDNSSWNRKIQRIAKKYGILKHVSAHVARHTFATRLLASNIPLTTIQKVIGHRRPETTMMYAKVSDNILISQFSSKR